jgi:predicted nuclease with TOPRIM domain
MELKIRKKNNDLVLEFPDDLVQLPSLLKNFSAMLAEPARLNDLEAENRKLKEQLSNLDTVDALKSRLAELGADQYCRLGEELGFVEVMHEDQNKAAEAEDPLSESSAGTSKTINIIR